MSTSLFFLNCRNIPDSNNVNIDSSIMFLISDSTTSSIFNCKSECETVQSATIAPFNRQFYPEYIFAVDCGRFDIGVVRYIGLRLRNDRDLRKAVFTTISSIFFFFWKRTEWNKAMRTLSAVYIPLTRIFIRRRLGHSPWPRWPRSHLCSVV